MKKIEEKTNKFKKIFFRFLKENGVYKPFFTNFNNRVGCLYNFENVSDDLINFCVDREIYSIIDQAFIWDKTKEGDYFWGKLNEKFNDLCEEIDLFND